MNIYFTFHAQMRMQTRKITKEEVIEIVKTPDSITKKYGKYYFNKSTIRGTIEIVCEKTENNINIITVYWI